ncbi:MAG TPA: hypothetical protein QKA08_01230 [Candidatus Megaira endosymbiont of Nemacystus decipiens]|nr:hypothetical protein [Candidatus Megaera endosymbiont of Nemacystus decipiens]
MITYKISPKLSKIRYDDTRDQKKYKPTKTFLPSIKGYLHFVTSDDYLNLLNGNNFNSNLFELDKQKLSTSILIRANSIVQYECGIKLHTVTEAEEVLNKLSIRNDCKPLQRASSYNSQFHLKHQESIKSFSAAKNILTTSYNFPPNVVIEKKTFELDSIGIDFSEVQLKNSYPSGGRYIQIFYANKDNNGYMKFKKPDDKSRKQNVEEISPQPEYDSVCVNIHFSIANNKKYLNYEEQLKKIGTQFQLATGTDTQINKSKSKIYGCNYKINLHKHFATLKKQFDALSDIAFSGVYQYCSYLDDACTTNPLSAKTFIGRKESKAFNVDFDQTTLPFLNLDILPEKLEAPENFEALMGDDHSS